MLQFLVNDPMRAALYFTIAGAAVLIMCAVAYILETVRDRREERYYEEQR